MRFDVIIGKANFTIDEFIKISEKGKQAVIIDKDGNIINKKPEEKDEKAE